MAIPIKNPTGKYQDEILNGLQLAINNIDIIQDQNLKKCIKKRLEKSGKIKVRRTSEIDRTFSFVSECYRNPDRPAYCFTRSIPPFTRVGEITLCISNIEKAGLVGEIWEIILHEFAHTCGWDGSDGKGVPGVYGFQRKN